MQLVQTYLGSAPDGGSTFVYYVAGTAPHHDQFTKEIVDRLFAIGRAFGHDVHLYGPHQSGHDHISDEVIKRYGDRWFEMMNQTPGFLITRAPFKDFDPNRDEGKFVSLADGLADRALSEVERIAGEQASWQRNRQAGGIAKRPSVWEQINSRVQITLNLGPVSIGPR